MGGCRCSYKNCPNSTKSTENVHFFHYPVKHKERCKIWIENANKPQFCDLEEDQLKNKVICEVHFEDKYFPNPQKKRLLQSAIPTLDGDAAYPTHCFPIKTSNTSNSYSIKSSNVPHNKTYPRQQLNQDVQILPANEDGTIFFLDTDNLYNQVSRPSSQVESYVYKNGVILPAQSNVEHNESKKLVESLFESNKEIDIVNVTLNKGSSGTSLANTIINNSHQKSLQQNYLKEPKIENMELEEHIPEESQLKSSKKVLVEKSVGRNYLRKINQHSRDIATIKRMLKQKNLVPPDMNKVLNMLKEKLPPTLYTIVELNLNLSNRITPSDNDFFQFLQSGDPNIYTILIDKYQWKLPDLQSDLQD